MDLNRDNFNRLSGELFGEEENHSAGELFVEREYLEEDLEEVSEEDEIPTWGVYYQGKEKTLLGLFWDEEMAYLFLGSVKSSTLFEKVKEIA